MPTDSSSVFTIEDLAEYLKISKSTLYKLAQSGALPGIKVGRHWRFHRDAVDEWLKSHPLDKKETKQGEQETQK
ncbi:MAG: helix-turn-helix domain-containing protein [Planctomycetes bacterium]|nr:helix-turn-helix domain-containing protein [Planctomycetota bacterium]